MVRHIVFDWDGTLFESAHAMLGADNAIATRFGWPEVDRAYYISHMSRDWRSYYDGLRQLHGNPPLTDDEVSQVFDAWHVAHDSLLDGATLAQDASKVLTLCRDAGITLSVCSMHPNDRLQKRIQGFGLAETFLRVDGLTVNDTGTMSKVDHLREHLRLLEELDVCRVPGGVAFVGDSLDDAASARDLGLMPVLVSTGELSKDRLEQEGAPVVASLSEALALLLR